MKKTISTVALSPATAQKINAVRSAVSTGFAKLSNQDVVEAVFKRSAQDIIDFVNGGKKEIESVAPVKRAYTKRRKKVTQLPKERREALKQELMEKGTVKVASTKEAASMYNYFKSKGKKVTYASKKRGGIIVELAKA